MKTKYVCSGLISLYVNFHINWTMRSSNIHVNICRWGGKEKEPFFKISNLKRSLNKCSFF